MGPLQPKPQLPTEPHLPPHLPELVEQIESVLLPALRLRSVDPHDPVRVESLPAPWRPLGCGNYAAVLQHPLHPLVVVKVYAPGRPGLAAEVEVYRRLGLHPAFSCCFHAGANYLVLRRLHGTTFYDCLRLGMVIPPQAIADIDAALAYAASRDLHAHDVHGRNLMLHHGRGLVLDVSDFLNPVPCRIWRDLRWAYHALYRPLIVPLGLRAPAVLLDGLRRAYRIYRRLTLSAYES
jgi:hypothetical protein